MDEQQKPTATEATPVPSSQTNPPANPQSPPDLTNTNPAAKSKKKVSGTTKILIGIGVLLLLTILVTGAALGYILLTRDSAKSDPTGDDTEDGIVEDSVDDVDGDEVDDVDDADFGPRKIAYMKDDNIWVMETDGTNKVQITSDGDGDETRYTAMDWKERGTLGYARCDGSCDIYTYDLIAETETLAHTPPPFTQSIAEITWSHDGTILGVLYTKADYSYAAYLVDGGGSTDIATFGIPPARGGGYSDGLQIKFSPDDTKVVVLNTIVDFGEDTIIATEVDGTPIVTIADATHPSFDGDSGFYFLAGGRIKKYTFATSSTTNIYLFGANGGYNIETSPDRNFIAFWDESDDGETHLYFHDVAGSPGLIADGFADPQWLDNSELVAIKTAYNEFGMGYLHDGLSKIERVGGAESVLETAQVYSFEIEPE